MVNKIIITQLLFTLVLLTFVKTTVYIIFDSSFFGIEKALVNTSYLKNYNNALVLFSIIRFILASIILVFRNFKIDLLNLLMIYLILISIIRFYIHYLSINYPKSKLLIYFDKILDFDSFTFFIISLYLIHVIIVG